MQSWPARSLKAIFGKPPTSLSRLVLAKVTFPAPPALEKRLDDVFKRLSKPSLVTDAKSNTEVLGSLFRPDESRVRRKRRLHVPSPSEPLDAAESEMNRGKAWARAGLPHIALHGLRRFFESLTESLDILSGVVAKTEAVAPTS